MSFWAVKGRSSSVEAYFHAEAGSADSLKLLTFQLGPNALDRRPDGSVIAPGDSVLITLNVTDPYHLVVAFAPSGLNFAQADQPVLTISWAACGDDLNYDGRVDDKDSQIVSSLGIWRQEQPTLPWFKERSTVSIGAREVAAAIPGFTGYALAF